MPRACDSCAVRKIKCNGRSPCSACLASSTLCSRVRQVAKPGPKGPRKRTEEAIRRIQKQQFRQDVVSPVRSESSAPSHSSDNLETSAPFLSPPYSPLNPVEIPMAILEEYLHIFSTRLYAIWPVIDADSLRVRLHNPGDVTAYSLVTSMCAATIAQLHLTPPTLPTSTKPLNVLMALASEQARFDIDPQDDQVIDTLLTCFFLHVFYTNTGRLQKSTVLLRETITYAHFLGLEKDDTYAQLPPDRVQPNLRIAWILFITDRAHSLQHDIPHIFKLSPTLPALSPEENPDVLPAFCSLCKLFWLFDSATEGRTEGLSHAIAAQLQEQYSMPSYGNEVQRADLLVTEPWLRIVLWKNALPFMTMTTEADSGGLSPFFPVEAARHLLGGLESVASDTLELHGPGMTSKLVEVTNSLADVIICMKSLPVESIHVRPRDVLHRLATLIVSLKNIADPAMMTILREKLNACTLDHHSPSGLLLTGSDDSPRITTLDDENDVLDDTTEAVTLSSSSPAYFTQVEDIASRVSFSPVNQPRSFSPNFLHFANSWNGSTV